jgi:crotonobetainyl-CoA:carnitine CoA-transferase CaiB-like acyl-CoA transferase
MIVAVGSDSQWTSCARALDLIDLVHDESLATNAGRLAQRDRVVSAVAEKLRTSNASEWIRVLDNAGVPCGVVKTVLEALREIDSSPLNGIAPSVPGSVRFPPPRLDEHGEEIRSLGWASFQNE